MNWKKIGLFSILALMILPLFLSFVAAQNKTTAGLEWAEPIKDYLVSSGTTLTWTTLIFSVIAIVILMFILYDLATLALPFGTTTNMVITGGFVIAAFLLGVVRTIVNFGLTIGATLAGGAGAISMIMSGVLFVLVLVVLFIGGKWLRKWIVSVGGRRKVMEAEQRGWAAGAKIREGRVTERIGAGLENP